VNRRKMITLLGGSAAGRSAGRRASKECA